MNSIYGVMASVISQFHWSVDYLMWGLPWITVRKMLLDMPRYVPNDDEKKKKNRGDSNRPVIPRRPDEPVNLVDFINKVNNDLKP